MRKRCIDNQLCALCCKGISEHIDLSLSQCPHCAAQGRSKGGAGGGGGSQQHQRGGKGGGGKERFRHSPRVGWVLFEQAWPAQETHLVAARPEAHRPHIRSRARSLLVAYLVSFRGALCFSGNLRALPTTPRRPPHHTLTQEPSVLRTETAGGRGAGIRRNAPQSDQTGKSFLLIRARRANREVEEPWRRSPSDHTARSGSVFMDRSERCIVVSQA